MTRSLPTSKSKSRLTEIQQPIKWLLITVVILLVASYVSNHWIQLLMVQGDSMLPSYHNMQIVMLDRYHDDYSHGDVIAFRSEALSSVLIKRIAACPGDTVVIENETLYVNGRRSAVYPEEGQFSFAGLLEEPLKLEPGQYIVIGDNITRSKDSRYPEIGQINAGEILGKVCQ